MGGHAGYADQDLHTLVLGFGGELAGLHRGAVGGEDADVKTDLQIAEQLERGLELRQVGVGTHQECDRLAHRVRFSSISW